MPVILHVEDAHLVKLLYKEVFEEEGFQVLQASTAEEALKVLEGTSPDVIILDLKMPGIGGTGFLRTFEGLKRDIPVVINSAYPYSEDEFQAGTVRAYIVKSGNMRRLVDKVNCLVSAEGFRP
jgi:DNA-binding response OmpR family regulator